MGLSPRRRLTYRASARRGAPGRCRAPRNPRDASFRCGRPRTRSTRHARSHSEAAFNDGHRPAARLHLEPHLFPKRCRDSLLAVLLDALEIFSRDHHHQQPILRMPRLAGQARTVLHVYVAMTVGSLRASNGEGWWPRRTQPLVRRAKVAPQRIAALATRSASRPSALRSSWSRSWRRCWTRSPRVSRGPEPMDVPYGSVQRCMRRLVGSVRLVGAGATLSRLTPGESPADLTAR